MKIIAFVPYSVYSMLGGVRDVVMISERRVVATPWGRVI